jgi:DNA primase
VARIEDHLIDRIRESVDLVDVIGEHVQLTRRGKEFVGLCPFHEDSNPSLNVSQDKQIYKCFVCGAGGNVYSFLQAFENVSFIEAVRELAARSGIPIEPGPATDPDRDRAFDALYEVNELARKYFHHMLTVDAAGGEARAYLEGRGVDRPTIDAFGLGYAPALWDGFLKVALRRGHSPATLESAGLISRRQGGAGHYDRFRNRVIFPIRAHTGRVVAFGARALDSAEQPKYLNSPETPVYNKSSVLYGLYDGRDAIRREKVAFFVEGYMDHLALAQKGILNVVATSGTALTAQHARLFRRYAEKAVLLFDGDAAGMAAAVRGITPLLEVGVEARIITLPDGQDPDDFIRANGKAAFLDLTARATSAVDFLLTWLGSVEDLSTADGKGRAAARLAEVIAHVRDEARQRFFVQGAAERLGLDEATLQRAVTRSARRPAPVGTSPPDAALRDFDPRPRAERELLIQMMSDDSTADAVLAAIRPEEFTNGAYRRIAGAIARRRGDGQSVSVAHLVDDAGHPALSRIISSLSMEVGIVNPELAELPIEDYISAFRIRALDREVARVEQELQGASGDGRRALLEAHRDLSQRRKDLKERPAAVG